MRMSATWTVFRKELRDLLRDRRTIVSMVVVPVLVFPLLMMVMGGAVTVLVKKAQAEPARIMILGEDHAPEIARELRALSNIEVVEPGSNFTNLISDKKIRAAVRIPEGFEENLESGDAGEIQIFVYQGELKSEIGASALDRYFRQLREKTVLKRLEAKGLDESLVKPYEIRQSNVASPDKVGGNLIGSVLPYIIILMSMVGGMYPAMDLTAGEKERGTIETLLCSPASRTQIVLGKFLMVLTASMATTFLSLCSLGGSFLGATYLAERSGTLLDFPISIDAWSLVAVFVIMLPVAIFFAAAMLTMSLFARSYKEAQSYISPMMLLIVVPAMASMLPGVELNSLLSLVPVLNVSLVSKEMMTGIYHWGHLTVIFVSSCAYAACALGVAVFMFQRESVLFRT